MCANRRISVEDIMEGNEMTEEEFEARALYEDYREELYRDRRRRLGWEDEDENFDGLDDSDRMQSSSN
jgi:hypothetical protein